MTSIRDLALKEPLVDVVEKNQVCMDTCLLKVGRVGRGVASTYYNVVPAPFIRSDPLCYSLGMN